MTLMRGGARMEGMTGKRAEVLEEGGDRPHQRKLQGESQGFMELVSAKENPPW